MIDEERQELQEEREGEETTVSTPQTSFQAPSYTPRGSSRKGVILRWLVILVILGALIFAGVSFFRAQQGQGTEEVTPTPTLEPSPTETPTPVPTSPTPTKKPAATPTKILTPTKAATKGLTVRVLNGSGVAGRAAEARDYLVSVGYAVSSVGNAENFTYEKVEIQITKAKESLLATLKKDLEGKYSVGTTSATLSSSEGVDAVVIIGKQ